MQTYSFLSKSLVKLTTKALITKLFYSPIVL